jgi:uncharacterized membrane protein YdfJ with MMPL/SSD domain
MIFKFLGHLVQRAWPVLLGAWGAVLLLTWYFTPNWADVAVDKELAFLPADAPSRRAAELFAKGFPQGDAYSRTTSEAGEPKRDGNGLGSNIVLIFTSTQGGDAARRFIKDVVEPRVEAVVAEEGGFTDKSGAQKRDGKKSAIVTSIMTPNHPIAGRLLVSETGQAMLVLIELKTEFRSADNWPLIAKIENLVKELRSQLPKGVALAMTGSAVIGRDNTHARLESVHATEMLSGIFVVVILLLLYRAPLLALIPVATVILAVKIAVHLLGILADAGFITLFQGIEIYITILSYGAGVDYCLFLMARYQEELEGGAAPADAVAAAVAKVGHALVASAATVICGIAMLMFANFGKFREAGFAIPLSLIMVLLATLTFSPALLRLAGRWAFWPRRQPGPAPVRQQLDEEPARIPVAGGGMQWLWEHAGRVLLRRPAAIGLATVALMLPFVVVAALHYDQLTYDLVGDLPGESPSVNGTRVLQEHFPDGIVGPTTVLVVNPEVNFGSEEGRELVAKMTDKLRQEKEALDLADIRSLTAPLGITRASRELSAREERVAARDHYTTSFGELKRTGTRIDLLSTENPFSHESMDALARIEEALRSALPASLKDNTQFHFLGTTASVRDLADVNLGDRLRVEALVLLSVLMVLIALLRRITVPIFLLLSVLFSYYVTLGVAYLVFWLLDPTFTGIDWKVDIFLFTILIAVGEDYNIFLLTRIGEEEKGRGPLLGITHALTRTGPIISSCGIIMAATFASLLAGSLTEMRQLGFALSFGVLLDTFVVRPILVPAFLILVRGGSAHRPWRRILSLRRPNAAAASMATGKGRGV